MKPHGKKSKDDDEKKPQTLSLFYFRNYCVYGYLLCIYTNDDHKKQRRDEYFFNKEREKFYEGKAKKCKHLRKISIIHCLIDGTHMISQLLRSACDFVFA